MYNQVYNKMDDVGVVQRLEIPVWMNSSGEVVEKEDALGCKVTPDLMLPEMCIVMDKVGGNISSKGDGNKGGQLFACAQGMTPQQKQNY